MRSGSTSNNKNNNKLQRDVVELFRFFAFPSNSFSCMNFYSFLIIIVTAARSLHHNNFLMAVTSPFFLFLSFNFSFWKYFSFITINFRHTKLPTPIFFFFFFFLIKLKVILILFLYNFLFLYTPNTLSVITAWSVRPITYYIPYNNISKEIHTIHQP